MDDMHQDDDDLLMTPIKDEGQLIDELMLDVAERQFVRLDSTDQEHELELAALDCENDQNDHGEELQYNHEKFYQEL